MKRLFLLFILLILVLTGCAAKTDDPSNEITEQSDAQSGEGSENGENLTHDTKIEAPKGDVVQITERLFIAQTNDIYINADDYLGKTIKYEGLFKSYYWEEADATYHYVIRYGPGCCGYDGEAGFEVVWEGEWPEEDDWCEVVGTLEEYEEDGGKYLRLVLSSLTVLDKRGAEYVST